MPGTIQVTVLEFKGASSSSQPSAKSLKVSMGKRYHQSWDKGDFSFPVIKLKENLVVTLLDAGENEIAHADIRTIHIIEKGCWDEVFSLEGEGGGWHVHMKLQFILNEEERKRIRVMRESAVKKKHETSPITDPIISARNSSTCDSVQLSTHSELKISDLEKRSVQIDIVRPNDDALQAESPLKSAIPFVESPYSCEEQESRVVGSAIPVKELMLQIEVKGAPSSPVKHETEADMKHLSVQTEKISFTICEEKSSVVPKVEGEDAIRKPQNEVSLKKPPSNVRKMISAFENSQAQETEPPKRAPKLVIQPADQSFRKFKDLGVAKILHQTQFRVSSKADAVPSNIVPSQAPKEPTVREMQKSTFDVMGQSTLETVTNLRRINEEQPGEVGSKSLNVTNIGVASNEKPKSLEYCKEEDFSSKSSGMWIFPDNRRHLCITTAGERVTRTLAHQCLEAKSYEEKEISQQETSEKHNVLHGTIAKIQNRFSSPKETGSHSSPDVSPNGLVGQVIKVVAILGFGVLVFLTRQKEQRKKNREDKDSLFTVPDYIDRMPFTES